MNSYKGIPKSIINARVRAAKALKIEQMIEWHGYIFCEDCGKNASNTAIDCSHDISVKQCQEDTKIELSLAWDVKNIAMRCRKCHQVLDKLDLQFRYD